MPLPFAGGNNYSEPHSPSVDEKYSSSVVPSADDETKMNLVRKLNKLQERNQKEMLLIQQKDIRLELCHTLRMISF